MIKIYPYEELGKASYGWLDTKYHFSFANYYNPQRIGFGKLLVINDDIVKAGAGFDAHPHRNMEIITYVKSGAITHRDSQGNEGKTCAGDVQVMSAGSGIFHSEYNLENEDTTLYQIWIEPKVKGLKPSWNSQKFPKNFLSDKLQLLDSGDGKAPLHINQDAYIYAGVLKKGVKISQQIKNQAYILLSNGEIEINAKAMKKGDGAQITNLDYVEILAKSDSEVLVIDVPNN